MKQPDSVDVETGREIFICRIREQCWELSVNLNELYLYTLKYVL